MIRELNDVDVAIAAERQRRQIERELKDRIHRGIVARIRGDSFFCAHGGRVSPQVGAVNIPIDFQTQGAVEQRWPHKPVAPGSTPGPATFAEAAPVMVTVNAGVPLLSGARRLFGSQANRRARNLGRWLAVSHPEWRLSR